MLNIASVTQKQKEKTISFPTLIKEEFTFQKFLRTAKQDSLGSTLQICFNSHGRNF